MQKTNELPNTSMESEKQHLTETLAVIHDNIENYSRDVSRMADEIEDMLEHFHDDNPELINTLENTITMHDHLKRALERNEKARNKPYFGRIIFHDEALDKQESLYIGKGGVAKDATNLTVIDWRAAVANAYYENGLGKCSYKSPTGKEIPIDLQLKRTYEIEEGKLLNFFDTEVVSNDELLTKYLSKNKEAVLGEIVATIQREQNEIIRKSPYHNIIVQGVAGSGKTTVAMHRISYILYNYEERFKPDDFYIVGSNRILLNYITSVLPDLDVEGVRQMTMEELFVRLLYEDWDPKKYTVKQLDKSNAKEMIKGRLDWFRDLERYCNELEWNTICRDNIYLKDRFMLLVKGSDVESYIKNNPKISLQIKINTLNERLREKVRDSFIASIRFTENEKKALLAKHHSTYGPPSWKKSIFAMYEEFLIHQSAAGYEVTFPENTFDVYDLAALAYLYKRIKETEVISEAHHVVVDEAQDFGMMAYSVLKFCIKDCSYTIMGDVSQNIHYEYGLNDWEDLKRLFLQDTDRASFNILKKSYRNTVEISDFATQILHHGTFSVYPVEPIIRHGKKVEVTDVINGMPEVDILANTKEQLLLQKTAEVCTAWQKQGLSTIAVICRDKKTAAHVSEALSEYIEVRNTDLEQLEFGHGIMVLPVEYTKGLEFDAVLIFNPTEKDYPMEDGHAKLLYVAATRALHELFVLHAGDLTELIAKPVSVRRSAATALVQPALEKMSVISESNTINKIAEKPTVKPVINPVVKTTIKPVVKPTAKPIANSVMKPVVTPTIKPKAEKSVSGISFGDIPATELLRGAGHSKADLSIMWINKQSDGIYLQSKYGILRISPVRSDMVRITFAKGNQITAGRHYKIAYEKGERACGYKETPKSLEYITDELHLSVDKSNGAITFMTRQDKVLLRESSKECRQFEITAKGKINCRNYFQWQKDESIYGHRIADKLGTNIRKSARYISHGSNTEDLPILISDKGYGIVIASDEPVFCCDIAAYGSYTYIENIKQLDYYFVYGRNTEEIIKAYEFLRGK